MIDTFQPSKAGRQAYMQRAIKAQQRGSGSAVLNARHAIGQAGGMGADILRHSIMLTGVLGLVAIAAGALTDSPVYYAILNWITGWFA